MGVDWTTVWEAIQRADPFAAADEMHLPLEEVSAAQRRPHPLRRLYRVVDGRGFSGDAYILAMPHSPKGRGPSPFSFIWAPSEGAVLRVAAGMREADDGALADPPPELMIEPGLVTRGAVQNWVRKHQPTYVEEGFAGFSPYVGPYVRVSHTVYYFRSMRWDPRDRPFAIEYDPRPVGPLFERLGRGMEPPAR
jgi:hypothetical protein